jgi:putative sigma-54 modulation protein
MRIAEIVGTHMELTDGIKSHLEAKIQKLVPLLEGVEPADIRADLGKTSEHHNKGKIFRAELNLTVPGSVLRAEELREDLYVAIDAAVNTLKENVKKYKAR